MKIVAIKGLWLLHWCTKFYINISSRLWVNGVSNVENRTHTRTHTYIRTPAKNHISRRFRLFWVLWNLYLKIFFSREHSFLGEEAKCCKPQVFIPYSFRFLRTFGWSIPGSGHQTRLWNYACQYRFFRVQRLTATTHVRRWPYWGPTVKIGNVSKNEWWPTRGSFPDITIAERKTLSIPPYRCRMSETAEPNERLSLFEAIYCQFRAPSRVFSVLGVKFRKRHIRT